ncbi:MAG: peptidylprolyl isomerase [Candidatus Altiarchaeales archaeon]|nr:peptidylprolyl isomerase [Candidatus Altiarchaeales archaeon]
MPVENGDTVVLEYIGKLDDGRIFDSTNPENPLKFEVGTGKILKGFEEGILGLEEGQEKQISLEPAQAYGDPNPQMIQEVPRQTVPDEAQEGSTLLAEMENGQQQPVKIKQLSDDKAVVDFNHPLAGRKLNFEVKVLEINP